MSSWEYGLKLFRLKCVETPYFIVVHITKNKNEHTDNCKCKDIYIRLIDIWEIAFYY